MANPDREKDYPWIELVKSSGSVPCFQSERCSTGWTTPPGDKFVIRGPHYFSDKVKIPGGEYLLKPLGFDWIKSPTKISEVLTHSNHRVRRAIDEEIASGNEPFVWAFNLQLPSKDNYSAIIYFVSVDPIEEGSLMDKFIKGDDAYRISRLKLIANIAQGPWIVRTAVGEQAICVLGRAVSCKYISGLNFIEVDVDIGASMVANAIVHLAFGYVKSLTVDLAFLIESQTEEELPERILGGIRFSELNPASATLYEAPSDDIFDNMQSSLPTRFWKTLGQGFSHLLNQGNQQDKSASQSVNSNANLDEKDQGTDVEDAEESGNGK